MASVYQTVMDVFFSSVMERMLSGLTPDIFRMIPNVSLSSHLQQ